jgi:ribosome-associated protein
MKRSPPFSLAARAAARAADEKKASDVLLYDVSRSSSLADYILIVTVESTSHAAAVEDAMDEAVLDVLGTGRVRRDGGGRVSWRVLDYGGLIVHLMSESLREFYGLERLWESVRPVAWKKKV